MKKEIKQPFNLVLPSIYYKDTLGIDYIFDCFKKSPLYKISFHNETIDVSKGQRGVIVYFEDKKIYIDFWEYILPTYSKEVYANNFDLIIKLQHDKYDFDTYLKKCEVKKIHNSLSKEEKFNFFKKIIPWTFFPSSSILDYLKLKNLNDGPIDTLPEKQLLFFCGKYWKCRHFWFSLLEKQNENNMILLKHYENNIKDYIKSDNNYIDLMRSSKYGLILAGRGSILTQAKNRREIDYMILKKPLLINYKPFYYDNLIEGHHYIYLDKNTRIKDLEDKYDIDVIAENGYNWYLKNASEYGIGRSFLHIMQSEFDFLPKTYFEV